MAKSPSSDAPRGSNEINAQTAAALIKCTPEWLRRLVKDGWIKKLGKDRFNLVDVVHGRIDYLQDENRRTSKSAAASRVQDARAALLEQQAAREQNRVVPVEEVEAFIGEAFGMMRQEFTGVPAASTRDLNLREEIEKHINGAIERCRRNCEAAISNARRTGAIVVDAEEGDA